MKVSGSKATGTSSTARKKSSGSGGAGGFSDAIRSLDSAGGASGAGGVHSTGTVSALDALLALQQSGDALDSPEKHGILRAESLLEQLEGLRDALFGGVIPAGRLRELVRSA